MITRDFIRGTLRDAVGDFLYYDRKEDKELPVGAIDEAIENGTVTVGDMVIWFEEALLDGLGRT